MIKIGLTKSGEIQQRSYTSRCQQCVNYIDSYVCKWHRMIPYRIWENIIGFDCNEFESVLDGKLNSHYIFPDFEDMDRFPEKKFGGIHRFDKFGNIIGKL